MNDNESELIKLLKDFINENKENTKKNAEEHKEINVCLVSLKLQLASVEALCQSSQVTRATCFQKQDDIEARMREVEKLQRLKDLPDRFDKLAKQVYLSAGAMTIIIILAGIWIKGFGA